MTNPSPSASAPEAAYYLGRILTGQYRVDAVLGQGGMGVVYRARQLTVGRDVAIKVLLRQLAHDPQATQRFENEARIVSRLRHPNTIRLYDCQRTEHGDLFFVTELLSGQPLSELLASEGHLTVERAIGITDQICRSLAEAHACGVVHRDLKPANVFIDRIGLDDVVKVLDFGIAKNIEATASLTRTGGVNGTPTYMSPEQALAKPIDARSDLYALGIMLYEMLAGAPPFRSASLVELLMLQVQAPLPPLGEALGERTIPDALDALITTMLEKDPERRPPSVDVVLAELACARSELLVPAPRARTTHTPLEPRSAPVDPRPAPAPAATTLAAPGPTPSGDGAVAVVDAALGRPDRRALYAVVAAAGLALAGAAGWLGRDASKRSAAVAEGSPAAQRLPVPEAAPDVDRAPLEPTPAERDVPRAAATASTTPPRTITPTPAQSEPAPKRSTTNKERPTKRDRPRAPSAPELGRDLLPVEID